MDKLVTSPCILEQGDRGCSRGVYKGLELCCLFLRFSISSPKLITTCNIHLDATNNMNA